MIDNRTTELRKALDFMRIWISDDAHLGESEFSYELEKAEGLRKLEAIEQAIAATLGSERELIDLAHNAWSMALCAMQGMPIPAEWGDAVERGLRKHGIDVDGELAGFEVVSE